MVDEKSDFLVGLYVNGGPTYLELDLEFLNIKFVECGSDDFKKFYKGLSSKDEYFQECLDDFQDVNDFLNHQVAYVALPIDVRKKIPWETFTEILNPILLLCPSSFKLVRTLAYDFQQGIDETNILTNCIYLNNQLSSFPEKTELSHIPDLNLFIKTYFERYKYYPYLKLPIGYYRMSFGHEELYMSFINLCISIESLIEGKSEVTYKIKRCCAVILSESKADGETIYDNIGIIYEHRSSIVHGVGGDSSQIQSHRHYLQTIIARIIVKLMLLSVNERLQLNDIITVTGYGENDSIFFQINPYYKFFVRPITDKLLKHKIPKPPNPS